MSRWKLMLGALVLTISFQGAVRAEVSVDVAKITRDQFLLFKVADPRDISIWLSEYYHGKRDTTVIDTQKFKDYSEKLRMYCRSNLTMQIMEARAEGAGVEKLGFHRIQYDPDRRSSINLQWPKLGQNNP